MTPLPIAVAMGWLFARRCGPPVRLYHLRAAGKICPCSQIAGGRSALQRSPPADTAQASNPSAAKPTQGESMVFRSWSRMAKDTQANQPDWLSPIATTSGRLKQEFRYDVWRQTSPSGAPVYVLGGGKGLELIVAPRIQILLGIPSYVNQMGNGPLDGF